MNRMNPTVLIIGYGNPGRVDDGLGPAFAKAAEAWNLPGVSVVTTYQLSVEDSHAVAQNDFVIFADATVNETDEFYFRKLNPNTEVSHTTHHLEPAAVLGLAHSLFDTDCDGFELGIRGFAFNDFGEMLSPGAEENLHAALNFIKRLLSFENGLNSSTLEPHKLISKT